MISNDGVCGGRKFRDNRRRFGHRRHGESDQSHRLHAPTDTRIKAKGAGPLSGRLAPEFPWGQHGADQEFESMADLQRGANLRLSIGGNESGSSGLHALTVFWFHGDLRPQNIFLSSRGNVVLLDWETACYYPALFRSGRRSAWPVCASSSTHGVFR